MFESPWISSEKMKKEYEVVNICFQFNPVYLENLNFPSASSITLPCSQLSSSHCGDWVWRVIKPSWLNINYYSITTIKLCQEY